MTSLFPERILSNGINRSTYDIKVGHDETLTSVQTMGSELSPEPEPEPRKLKITRYSTLNKEETHTTTNGIGLQRRH